MRLPRCGERQVQYTFPLPSLSLSSALSHCIETLGITIRTCARKLLGAYRRSLPFPSFSFFFSLFFPLSNGQSRNARKDGQGLGLADYFERVSSPFLFLFFWGRYKRTLRVVKKRTDRRFSPFPLFPSAGAESNAVPSFECSFSPLQEDNLRQDRGQDSDISLPSPPSLSSPYFAEVKAEARSLEGIAIRTRCSRTSPSFFFFVPSMPSE